MKLRGSLYLMLASFFWGTTFVAQMAGMDNIGPFTYGMGRYILGFLVVLFIAFIFRKSRQAEKNAGRVISGWKAGLGAGCIMFTASALQQVAMLYTTAGKTAFITCMYIIFVPLLAVFIGQRIKKENWAGAIIALAGLYLLSVKGDFNLNQGDIYAFIGAIFWSFHIMYIDKFASRVDAIELSAAQLAMCALLNTVVAGIFETYTMATLLEAAIPIIYAAVLSSGVAFTLQIVGQKYAEPSHAAIIMSLESVFGALSGWLILGEHMASAEVIGCFLMVIGMLVTQAGVIFKNKFAKTN